MTSDKVLWWATLAASLGAVVGLILLVLGLKQNEAIMKAQTRNELSVGIVEAWRAYAQSSPALVKFWCAERSQFSPEFMLDFDALLPRDAC